MIPIKPILIASLALALFLAAWPGAAAAAKSCPGAKENGITKLRATNVGCDKAREIAVAFSYRMEYPQGDKRRVKGWTCNWRSVSREHEHVTCKRSGKKISFRSTKQIELPPASAPPCVNCAGRV